jgi:hypothetical protein
MYNGLNFFEIPKLDGLSLSAFLPEAVEAMMTYSTGNS